MFAVIKCSWAAMILSALAGYLCGSINWAIIITQLHSKKDIRSVGSGNAGATNVLRSQGVVPALLTALGDLGKGVLSSVLGGFIMTYLTLTAAPLENEELRLIGQYIAGLFCVIGHIYPLYHGFRGGKGVMVALGLLIVVDWRITLLELALFGVAVAVGRMVSLGSVIVASYLPVLTLIFRLWVDEDSTGAVIFCVVLSSLIAAIVIWKHGSNMRRIAKGTERRLGDENNH